MTHFQNKVNYKILALFTSIFIFSGCNQNQTTKDISKSNKDTIIDKSVPEEKINYPPKDFIKGEISNVGKEDILKFLYPQGTLKDNKTVWKCKSSKLNQLFSLSDTINNFETTIISIDILDMQVGQCLVVISQTKPTYPVDYNCHPCAPIVDVGLFRKKPEENNWVLFDIDTLGQFGCFGEHSPVSVLRLGSLEEIGILIEPGFTNFGYTEGSLELFIYTTQFSHALHFKNAIGGNEGSTDDQSKIWSFNSKMEVLNEPKDGTIRIKITRQGTREGKSGNIEEFKESFIYAFDGSKYLEEKE
jgi:hypothetical protein